jgi:hypothetical protein
LAQDVARKPLGTRSEPLSICSVVAELQSYRGKTITVRGNASITPHLFAIGGVGNCEKKFVTNGYEWTSALSLISSIHKRPEDAPMPFVTDSASVERLKALLRKRASSGERPVLGVTIVGQVRARHRYLPVRYGDGETRGNGYGYMAFFPGQLVIKTVLDVESDEIRP